MSTIRARMSGPEDVIETILAALRGADGVEHVEEVAAEVPHARDDSSSAGLADDEAGSVDFHDIAIHATDDAAAEAIRNRLSVAARKAGLVVEWPERF